MPIGIPGWPELAACTASIESALMAFASCFGPIVMPCLVKKGSRVDPGCARAHLSRTDRIVNRTRTAIVALATGTIVAEGLIHAIIELMTDDRLITAIGRLERALSRIEAMGASPARAGDARAENLHSLQERHQRLRARTQDVIARLDRLLGENGGDARRQNGNGVGTG